MADTARPPEIASTPEAGRASGAGRIAAALLAVGLVVLVAACASSPSRGAAEPEAPGRVTLVGNRATPGAAAEQVARQTLAAEGKGGLAAHHLAVLAEGGDVDLYRGNAARLLADGPATFAAMKAAIGRARHRVLLQSYIVEDQGVAAEVGALLARKAREGVQVALLYDSVGSIATPEEFFAGLRAQGVATCAFNPLAPDPWRGNWAPNNRDHRKLLVVDDAVAFTGGINISRVYGSGSFARRKGDGGTAPLEDGWRDTQVELRGPVAAALAQHFGRAWHAQRCTGELGRAPAGAGTPQGTRIVKIVESDPRDSSNRIYDTLRAAIAQSRVNVSLTMAYFAPGADFVDALAAAARRGVKVQLVLPGRSDFALVLDAGRAYYEQLLDAGVQIHEMDHAMMHAKTAVVDGVFATVGSSNLDWRSIVDNHELNVIVLGDDFGADLQAMFDRDVAASRRIDAAQWAERPLQQRLREVVGRLSERWL